jgi:hypothetical protein
VDLGFDTAGNAILIVYDRGPLLVTDPWFDGPAYFGSWTQSHDIGDEQRRAITSAPFVWISHGHPDHLSNRSVEHLRSAQVLLPDHVGGRIATAFREDGYRVSVLPDRTWTRLSDRVRVLCFADPSQDAVLLVEVGDTLIANLNDTANSGWAPFVRREARRYKRTFVLAASGYGDIRGMNYFDETGQRLESYASLRAEARFPLGQDNARLTDLVSGTHYVPFSSTHQYQRADSVWANQFIASLTDYGQGYSSSRSTALPAFVRYDATLDRVTELNPSPLPSRVIDPQEFGDNWTDPLDHDELQEVAGYFRKVEGLRSVLDYIEVRVGGQSTTIELVPRSFRRGVTFELPRQSLLTTVRYEVFEDLFIGNFMKTTYHGCGEAAHAALGKYLKWADNGRAWSSEETTAYLAEYDRRLGAWNRLRFQVEQLLLEHAQRSGFQKTAAYRLARNLYRRANGS